MDPSPADGGSGATPPPPPAAAADPVTGSGTAASDGKGADSEEGGGVAPGKGSVEERKRRLSTLRSAQAHARRRSLDSSRRASAGGSVAGSGSGSRSSARGSGRLFSTSSGGRRSSLMLRRHSFRVDGVLIGSSRSGSPDGGDHDDATDESDLGGSKADVDPERDAEGEFYLDAVLGLLETRESEAAALGRVLPALEAVLAKARAHGGKEDPAIGTLESWMERQLAARMAAGLVDDESQCGWLKKLDSSKLRIKRRWCVLDENRLMYYTDKTEGELKGVLNLSGCDCVASSAIKDMRRFTFEVRPPKGATINPLHASKAVYRFVASNAADRDKWIKAICTAAGKAIVEDSVAHWQQLLHSCSDVSAYSKVLVALSEQSSIEVSADYVRARMRVSTSRSSLSDGEDGAVRAAKDAAKTSTERRRVGYSPGDRVSLEQLEKDVKRDAVAVDSLELVAVEANRVAEALTRRVRRAMADAALAATRAGFDESFCPPPSAPEVMAFVRDVLLCSSRTVAGGDVYDALDMVFGNAALVMLCPDSAESPPMNVDVETVPLPTPASAADAPSSRLASGSPGANHRRSVSAVETTASKAPLLKPKMMGASVPVLGRSSDSSTSIGSTDGVEVARWSRVAVTVTAEMRYRIMKADPMGDETDNVGIVVGKFCRRFLLDDGPRHEPAVVHLSVASPRSDTV